jgi:hypothetical protein
MTETIDTYCAAWSESDPAARLALLRASCAEDVVYLDPRGQADGIEALAATIADVLASRPGARVVRTSAIDAHHGRARFAWHVMLADGTGLPEGLDIVELCDDGRLRRILGFFGPLASSASSAAGMRT